jgi:hypothetical protein
MSTKYKCTSRGGQHLFNLCECGLINQQCFSLNPTDNDNGNENGSSDSGGIMGGKGADIRGGKAFIAVAITEKQASQQNQYNDDSIAVAGGLDSMATSLDALNSDIKELSRCVNKSTLSAKLLQKVQERVNKEIKQKLSNEKISMAVKDASLKKLERKLKKIRLNQQKIIAGYRAYQALRYIVVAVLLWAVIMSVLFSQQPAEPASASVPPSVVSPSPLPSVLSAPSPAPADSSTPTPASRRSLDRLQCACESNEKKANGVVVSMINPATTGTYLPLSGTFEGTGR